MRHVQHGPLSERQRRMLVAIAEAALPAGKIFPGAGAHTIDKVEQFLALMPEIAGTAAGALLAAVDAEAYLRHGRGFTSLGLDDRLQILTAWRNGGMAR